MVDAYNNTPHQSLGGEISPNDVFDNKKDYQIVQSINTAKIGFNNSVKKISNIKVGDNVRIQIKKGTFTKGYKLTYSAKIYQVLKIENNEADLTDNKREKLKNLMVINGNDMSTNKIDEAEKRDAKVFLVIGMKTTRWPECHLPEWAKNLDKAKQQEKILRMIEKIILRYKP